MELEKRRIAEIAKATGTPVVKQFISPLCLNAKTIERHLHQHFAEYRQEGEWFQVDFQTAVEEANKQTFETEEPGKLLTFEFESNQLRTMVDEKGELWFCLKDACAILEIINPRDVRKRLNPKGVDEIYSLTKGGKQELTFVNEPNFYKVIFGSRKKEAVKFQDWVFDEVLLSIRKTGQYSLPNQPLKGKVEQIDFAKFIEDCLIPDPSNLEKSRDIYLVYQSWCLQNKYPARTIQWVGTQLRKQGYKKGKCPPKGVACWYGFRLNNLACPANPTTLEDLQSYLSALSKNARGWRAIFQCGIVEFGQYCCSEGYGDSIKRRDVQLFCSRSNAPALECLL